jgi:hypothetical protein
MCEEIVRGEKPMATEIRLRVIEGFRDGQFRPDDELRFDVMSMFSETKLTKREFTESIGLSMTTFANFFAASKKLSDKKQIAAAASDFKPVLIREESEKGFTIKFPEGFEIEVGSLSEALPILERLMELKR